MASDPVRPATTRIVGNWPRRCDLSRNDPMTRSLSWLLVLLLAGVFVGVAAYALWLRVRAGKDMPDYSVYSEGADGLSDAARFLHRTGFEPVAVTRPIGSLQYRGLLIL